MPPIRGIGHRLSAMQPEDDDRRGLTRRRFLEGSALVPIVFAVGACGADDETASTGAAPSSAASEPATTARTSAEAAAEAGELQATPSCDDGDDPTPRQTEGPFYTPDTPRRSNLAVGGVSGAALLLTGDVVDTRCRPIRGALLDFWQADARGEYDNEGFRLRGHQFADSRGRFGLRTIVPGLYPGRTRHIHVKVQRPHGQVLTTQAVLPGRAPQPQRRHLRRRAAHGHPPRRRRAPRAVPLHPALIGVSSGA
jgi:protocatechuate 3,4-dioxygenase beta subunit